MKTYTQPLFTFKKIMASLMISASLTLSIMAQAQLESKTEGMPLAPNVSAIELAYKKELAFLQAQKHNLQGRLTRLLQGSNDQFDVEKMNIRHLEEEVITSNNLVQLDKAVLLDAKRVLQANEDNSEIFTATFLQADASLEKYLGSLESDKAFQNLSDGAKVTELFNRSNALLKQLSSVYKKQGDFHLLDGSKVTGQIIHLGNVARFGIAMLENGDQVGGMLAPAGEGLFKLWAVNEKVAGLSTALALANGGTPQNLDLFLVENPQAAVQAQSEKTVMDILKSGGIIGYIIVAFGVVALLMVLARALFLRRASHASAGVLTAVRPAISRGDINQAMDISREYDGATSRVVRATVRNLDRDREHLEDIVSESILHESDHLDRFGTTILVLAAVSPLMGLLGTVTGMIATFDVITEFGTGDPKMLSGGISEALVTTELGLVVAIPAVLLGNLLSGWAERIKNDMELGALHLINVFKEKHEIVNEKEAA